MPTDTRWHVTIPILTCGWDATNHNPHFPAFITLGGRGARVAIADTTETDFCPPSQSQLQPRGPVRPRIAGAPSPYNPNQKILPSPEGGAIEDGPGARLEPTAKSVYGMMSSSRLHHPRPHRGNLPTPPDDECEKPSDTTECIRAPHIGSHPFVVGPSHLYNVLRRTRNDKQMGPGQKGLPHPVPRMDT